MDDQGTAEQVSTGSGAWTSSNRTLFLIASVVFALLGILALAAAIDRPSLGSASRDSAADDQLIDAGADEIGQGSDGEIKLGPDGDVSIRVMPDCPGGFSIGERIYVVPDPEACGLTLTPGGQEIGPNDIIILTPGMESGAGPGIGRIRINPDGSIELLPPGPVGPNDFTFGWSDDDVFGLVRPDGSRVEIVPGDDGLSLRDPSRGGTSLIPRDEGSGSDNAGSGEAGSGDAGSGSNEAGAGDPGAEDGQDERLDTPPSLAEPDATEPADNSGSSDSSRLDWSFVGPLLLVIAALCFIGFLVVAIRGREQSPDEVEELAVGPEVQSDYAAEISALDRLLWEIEQEPDPRLAIQRVYAALETGLDNPAMARKLSETPGIYLRRVLGHFTVLEGPLQELTDLFEQARFSEHEITVGMRDRAVTALMSVREHYAHAAHATAPPAAAEQAGFGAR